MEDNLIEIGKKNKEILIFVEPTNFWASEQTIKDNPFMLNFNMSKEETTAAAIIEHRAMIKTLNDEGIATKVFQQENLDAFDSVYVSDIMIAFKNKDFPTGVVVLCPMFWPSRRLENNPLISKWIIEKCGYEHMIDLTYFEAENKALEGRGVTLFDWKSRCVYIGRSNRANPEVLAELTQRMTDISGKQYDHYIIESFDLVRKVPHFHTACFLMILKEVVIIEWSSVELAEQRIEMKEKFLKAGYKIIEVNYDEMNAGAAMIVEFNNLKTGGTGIICTTTCLEGFTEDVRKIYNEYFSPIIAVDLNVHGMVGGSSVECMIQPVQL